MFTLSVPPHYFKEREYIIRVLFDRFLGIPTEIRCHDFADVRISLGDNQKQIHLPDLLFCLDSRDWLAESSLPELPLQSWQVQEKCLWSGLAEPDVPVLFGKPLTNGSFFEVDGNDFILRLGVDILGSCFFLLTRYEEIANPVRDRHGRFPASASIAHKAGFLNRPIVNEYLEILWACMKYLWPELTRPKRQFRLRLTHDVDVPFLYAYLSRCEIVRRSLRSFVTKNREYGPLQLIRDWRRVNRGHVEYDPCNTFDYIMDLSEFHGLKSSFYFMSGGTGDPHDNRYRVGDELIKQLMSRIAERGHSIGIHPSYQSYNNIKILREEFSRVTGVYEEVTGSRQTVWDGRQHYLRWRNPVTWQIWDEVGLASDSTLGFADHAGFRCGTCYPFPVFDLRARKALNLVEHPLILMDRTVLAEAYMNLGLSNGEALSYIMGLKDTCRKYCGEFTVLWHNNCLQHSEERDLFQCMVAR